jgi:hypothetical protein
MGLGAAVSGFGMTAKAFGLKAAFKPSLARDRGDGEMAMAK